MPEPTLLRAPRGLDPLADAREMIDQGRRLLLETKQRFVGGEKEAYVEDAKQMFLRTTVPGYSALLFAEAMDLELRRAELLGREDLVDLLTSLTDPAYLASFSEGVTEGEWDGVFEAIQTRVDDLIGVAETVMEVQRSINDPMLWVLGVVTFLEKRGSPDNEAAKRLLIARLETYEYFRKLRKIITDVPKLLPALLSALRNPEKTIAHLIVELAQQTSTEFRETQHSARQRGYFIGKLAGRAMAEALLIVLDIIGLPELLLGKIAMEVPEIADAVRRVAAKFRRIPIPNAAEEVLEESERIAAGKAARALERATPLPPAARPLPKVPIEVGPATRLMESVREKFPLLKQLPADQLNDVLDYARANRNRFSVKGILAEQLIPHNPKYEELLASVVARLGPDWDPASVQYVRRVVGIAPTETTAGGFADLADGFIVALRKNPAPGQPRVNIVAVFEAKSPTNVRDLAFGADGDIGQLGWTLERIGEVPLKMEVRTATGAVETWTLDPTLGELTYSPRRDALTAKRLIVPKDHQMKASEIERMKEIFPEFDPAEHVWRHPESNDDLQKIADHIVDLMNKEHPKAPPKKK